MTAIITGIASSFKILDKEIDEEGNKELRKKALAAFADLKTLTPVDTGRARSAWLISDRETYSQGGSTVPAITLTNKSLGTIYITNGTTYIQFLNSGASIQAPSKFIEQTLRKYFDEVQIDIINN